MNFPPGHWARDLDVFEMFIGGRGSGSRGDPFPFRYALPSS